MPKGHKLSAETKAKMSAAKKGAKNPMFGKHHLIPYKHTEETKRRIRESCKNNKRMIMAGERNGRWRGGRIKTRQGYVLVWCPSHPYANKDNRVMEHRLVMEAHLGRTLLPAEVVHHINGIRDDNRIENLMLFSNSNEHSRFHKKEESVEFRSSCVATGRAHESPPSRGLALLSNST